MYAAILEHVPKQWNEISCSHGNPVLQRNSEEFRQIEEELKVVSNSTCPTITCITRIQDVYNYGQFLLREQLMIANSNEQLYRVRRFITVHYYSKDVAIKTNLDPRRSGLGKILTFSDELSFIPSTHTVFVVQVLTYKPNLKNIIPGNFLEYYIEYVIDF